MTTQQAFTLAFQHHEAGRLADAEALYRQILAAQPNHADALHHLGVIARQGGHHAVAVERIRQALVLDPNNAAAYSNLGASLADQGQFEEAVTAYRRAIQLRPDYAETHFNLGNALTEQGQLVEAVEAYHRALRLKPNYAEAHNNLGAAMTEQGRIDEAMVAFRRTLQLEPDHGRARFNLSLQLLLRGDFEPGWPLFEARWTAQSTEPSFSQPKWDGSKLGGRRVLVHFEQGFGDSIQFIRYAALIAGRGGEVIFECQRPLVELFRGAKAVSEVVAAGDPLPPFDVHVPMLSQPLVFNTTLETIPRESPYLFADPARCETWRGRLGGDRSRLRVGLAWMGNTGKVRMRKRHVALDKLLPILHVEGVDFFSLQMDRGAEQIRQTSGASGIVDHTGHIHDFSDTAAFITELDLIISVDTAVAHLAGALGRPVWMLLPFVPDWRWGLESEATPWYPTMRLFRQPTLGNWDAVIERLVGELRHAANDN